MDYTLIPPLKHIALVKISALLWNHADIRTLIFWFPFSSNEKLKKWREIELVVIEKASHLSLPKPLRKYVLCSIKPIGIQIFSWLDSHKNLYFGILRLPSELCFTMQGLLDSKKTAEALIQDESLHIVIRYRLACTYCLSNSIPELWNKIPENLVNLFFNTRYSQEFKHLELVVGLWTHEMRGELFRFGNVIERTWFWHIEELESINSPYQFAFEYSARVGNTAATEFFLQKLTPSEIEESRVRCFQCVSRNRQFWSTQCFAKNRQSTICVLLSQMDKEQQLRIYAHHPLTMLEYSLDWPWQSFFIETADRACDYLTAEDYDHILNKIVLKVIDGYQDWNYRQLFGQFWQKGAGMHKRFVLDKCIRGRPLLRNLLKIKDMANMLLLFQDATVVEKEEIVYYRRDIVGLLIYNDGWSLLKTLLEHIVSLSGDIVGKLQQEFRGRDLTSSAKEDMDEEKAILKKFFRNISRKNLIHIPRYYNLDQVDWGKEMARSRRLPIRPKLPTLQPAVQLIQCLTE